MIASFQKMTTVLNCSRIRNSVRSYKSLSKSLFNKVYLSLINFRIDIGCKVVEEV